MDQMRECKVCGAEKPIDLFGKTVSAGNGQKYHRHECRNCVYKRQASWRLANKNRLRETGRASVNKMRAKRMEADPVGFRAEEGRKAKEYRKQLKNRVYAAYGGYKCNCCGETEPSFLSLDHIHNDGYQKRKEEGHGAGATAYLYLWREFKKTGVWSDQFQILCMNCQHGKSRNGGACPHKQERV